MNHGAQDKILEMIRSRKMVKSREIVREVPGWDFRKAICRLQKKGFTIRNVAPRGQEGCYLWVDNEQGKLI